MASEKLEITVRIKNKTWTNPQIKNHRKSHELRLIRPQTKYRNTEHTYSEFVTPLTPSVEKILNLHGLK
jgi:hypothetical protein